MWLLLLWLGLLLLWFSSNWFVCGCCCYGFICSVCSNTSAGLRANELLQARVQRVQLISSLAAQARLFAFQELCVAVVVTVSSDWFVCGCCCYVLSVAVFVVVFIRLGCVWLLLFSFYLLFSSNSSVGFRANEHLRARVQRVKCMSCVATCLAAW